MAKKKDTHHPKQQQDLKPHQHTNANSITMQQEENPLEKIQSLKQLNSILLKETHERRQQVDALVESKRVLESELTRYDSEREVVTTELTRLSDQSAIFELEKGLMSVFVAAQMGEIGVKGQERVESLEREIERARGEREDEVKALNEMIENLERREKGFVDEVGRLSQMCEGLVEEKKEKESAIESLMVEKGLVERKLDESTRAIKVLKKENEEIVREKDVVELERSRQVGIVKELEREVSELKEDGLVFRSENEKLHGLVLKLEKSRDEVLAQKEQIGLEYNVLKDQNEENERKIEMLEEEKTVMLASSEERLDELNEQKRKLDRLIQEKEEMEKENVRLETGITELKKELHKVIETKSVVEKRVVELEGALDVSKQMCDNQVEEINRLSIEISRYRAEIEGLMLERDDVKKCLDEEKINVSSLSIKVSEMNKVIEESAKELEQMRSQYEDLNEAKKGLETQIELSVKEKDSLEKSLENTQQNIRSMMIELESVRSLSEVTLSMLKKTASVVSLASGEMNGKIYPDEENIEIQPYITELEVIRNAFKSKEMKVEDMKRQLEFLQKSVVEAHKKKSFWTLMTSAATIFAAASVAYAARGGR